MGAVYTSPKQALRAAIDAAIETHEYVTFVGDLVTFTSEASVQGYDTDWARLDGEEYDVWGWTDDTPEPDMAWRIRVIHKEDA